MSASGNGKVLAPVRPQRNLTEEVVRRLRQEITKRRLVAGQRLPTEQEMMDGMGVSRTVVREAVAQLKAQGFIVTRQGSGAYVAKDPGPRGFEIDAAGLGSLEKVLQILELRLAVEVEAAALASVRASRAKLALVCAALEEFEAAVKPGAAAVTEDFAFHAAIAAATENPRFEEFLRFVGRLIIPRQSIRIAGMTTEQYGRYLRTIVDEHRSIYEAIAAHNPDSARMAMRSHLARSADRYRGLGMPARPRGRRGA